MRSTELSGIIRRRRTSRLSPPKNLFGFSGGGAFLVSAWSTFAYIVGVSYALIKKVARLPGVGGLGTPRAVPAPGMYEGRFAIRDHGGPRDRQRSRRPCGCL